MKNQLLAAATLIAATLPHAAFSGESPFVTAFNDREFTISGSGRDDKPAKPVAKARKSVKVKGGGVVASAGAAGKAAKGGSGRYGALIARYAAAYGVPYGLATAVVRVESNFRPNARGGAGEIGLMQIKPATARMLGYSGSASGLFNPETNLKYGMKYLGQAHRLGGGSVCGTILKYNAGHGARRMNPVSAAYCGKVKRIMGA